jgi:hypothetical protein
MGFFVMVLLLCLSRVADGLLLILASLHWCPHWNTTYSHEH